MRSRKRPLPTVRTAGEEGRTLPDAAAFGWCITHLPGETGKRSPGLSEPGKLQRERPPPHPPITNRITSLCCSAPSFPTAPLVWEPKDNQSSRPNHLAPASSPFGSPDPSPVALPASVKELWSKQSGSLPTLEQEFRAPETQQSCRLPVYSSKSGLPAWAPVHLLVGCKKSHTRAILERTAKARRRGVNGLSRAGGGKAERPARPERGGPGRPGFVVWTRPCRRGLGKLFH